MATPVKLPRMGANMEEGTIIQWLKKVGDPVRKGEVLLEIATDKVNAEVEAPADGILLRIDAEEGATVPVGQQIGLVGEEGEVVDAGPSAPPPAPAPAAASPASPPPAAAANGGRVRASPAARRLARELGVDLRQVTGTGPSGRVKREDVLRASGEVSRAAQAPQAPAAPPPPPPAPAARPAASAVERIRRLTAERMMQSLQGSAQLTLTMSADVTELDAVRRQLQNSLGEGGPPVTFTVFLLKALALSLRAVPDLLARWDDKEGLVRLNDVHLGMAVAIEGGLMVPVLRHADRMSLLETARWVQDAAARAREGRLTPDELGGGVFSLTNLGAYPVEYFTPILNPPESGILGVGRASKQPVVLPDDQIAVRLILPLSLTWDHRVADGVPAARLAAAVKDLLEHPLRLLAS